MVMSEVFAKNVRHLRKLAGIVAREHEFSQQELADFIGISRKTVNFWENGHVPPEPKIATLCEFFTRRLGLLEPILPSDFLNSDLTKRIVLLEPFKKVMCLTESQSEFLGKVISRIGAFSDKDLSDLESFLADL